MERVHDGMNVTQRRLLQFWLDAHPRLCDLYEQLNSELPAPEYRWKEELDDHVVDGRVEDAVGRQVAGPAGSAGVARTRLRLMSGSAVGPGGRAATQQAAQPRREREVVHDAGYSEVEEPEGQRVCERAWPVVGQRDRGDDESESAAATTRRIASPGGDAGG
jgi:hypothetical protein